MAALAKPWRPATDYQVYAKTEAESVGQAVAPPSGNVWALFQTRRVMNSAYCAPHAGAVSRTPRPNHPPPHDCIPPVDAVEWVYRCMCG